MWDILKGAARHVIGLAGGVLVGLGVSSPDDVSGLLGQYDAVVGGLMAVVAFGLSAIDKIKGLFNRDA